ncbi:MAG TPA: DUF4350 domain-containing protein [Acidobacteriaceae bacterium]|nr:DUF4350 domain-containing protein [Acidobacteriaceae bacterium]
MSRSSLSGRDRRLLFAFLIMVAVVLVVVAVLGPQQDDQDRTPSTFSSGTHGAEAAYLALEQSGYRMERWEQPLSDLVPQVNSHTVVIFAEPNFNRVVRSRTVVQQILDRGGRVLVTGMAGGFLLPEDRVQAGSPVAGSLYPSCDAQPEGFGALADSGMVHMRASYEWHDPRPNQRVQYTCRGNAVVVSFPASHGQVIWWADSQPLENAFIAKDGDLALLLASIGTPGNRIVWDESLHDDEAGLWSYAKGTPVHLLWAQLAVVALLLVLSFSRRSGPLLPDPVVARDAPLEFVYSLGALYDKAGATNTAVEIAYDRFRMTLGRAARPENAQQTEEMIGVARARLGRDGPELRETIKTCEELRYAAGQVQPGRALMLVRALNKFGEEVSQTGGTNTAKK